jgi:sortase A
MLAEFASAVTLAFAAPVAEDSAIEITPPPAGARYGTVVIPRIGIRFPVISGTSQRNLKRGVAHMRTTYLPGMGGTVALFGHRVTPTLGLPHGPFYNIDKLKRGDRIRVRMPYGNYNYRVQTHKKISRYDWRNFRPRLDRERLVLAACHPKGSSRQRYVVIARRASA